MQGYRHVPEDVVFYRRRAVDEEHWLRSDRKNVREIHEELARQYEALVEHEELRSEPIRMFS